MPRAESRRRTAARSSRRAGPRRRQHCRPGGFKRLLGAGRRVRTGHDPKRHLARAAGKTRTPAAAAACCRARLRTGERSAMPGSRQVRIGSSASAVPMPVMIASLCARSRCTRSRAGSPGNGDRLAASGPSLAVGRDRELEHDVRAGRRACGGCGRHDRGAPRRRRDRHRRRCRRRAAARGRRPATSGLGSSSAETTRAMPAAMMASAQGGDLPWCEQGSSVT